MEIRKINGKHANALAPIALFRNPFLAIGPMAESLSKAASQHVETALEKISKRELDGAVDELRKALDIDQKNSKALAAMGKIMLMKNNFEESLSYFNRAIEADPENLEVYQLRGQVRHILGDEQGLHEDMGVCNRLRLAKKA